MKGMTAWLTILILGVVPVPVVAQTAGGLPQPEASTSLFQLTPPTYAIHLLDGRTALVWWDARSDLQQPRWVCEVPPLRDGTDASVTVLPVAHGDWRGALETAKTTVLRGCVADGM